MNGTYKLKQVISVRDARSPKRSPRIAKKRKLIEDSDSEDYYNVPTRTSVNDDGVQPTAESSRDAVTDEIDSWKHMPRDKYRIYEDEDGILNEFQMMWDLREEYPIHYIVFKQCAAHLLHEANVEQYFSLAGGRFMSLSLMKSN